MIGLLLSLSAPATAADLLAYWDYDSYANGASMVGVDGWSGGYATDLWVGVESDGGDHYVYSTTDDNTDDAPGDWGDGGAIDNWLVNRRSESTDQVVRASLYVQDNDSVGIICRFQDDQNYLLFLMVGLGGSNPVGLGANSSGIVRVQDGEATVLESSSDTFTTNALMGVQLWCDDDTVIASAWEELDADWTRPDFELTATDEAPGAGIAGFYAYDAGGDGEGASFAYFGAIEVLQVDADEDGVADDTDNCEEAANADQADADGDSVGDVCDDTPGTDSGGTDSGSEGGTDSAGDDTGQGTEGGTDSGSEGGEGGPGGEGGSDTGGGTKIPVGDITSCACGSAPRAALGWPLVGLALALLRRRRG